MDVTATQSFLKTEPTLVSWRRLMSLNSEGLKSLDTHLNTLNLVFPAPGEADSTPIYTA